jgi:carbonic anhydrase
MRLGRRRAAPADATSNDELIAWLGRSAWCAAGALPLMAESADGAPWQISGEYGPERWGRMNPADALCDRGRRQSPIDIVATRRQPQPALQFHYRGAPLRVVNDGHTVRVRFANNSRMLMGGESLTLQQFHFHIPGGDRVRGEQFPMAMHFVHKSKAGRLVSLVVLFRRGAENPALAVSMPKLPVRGQPEQRLPSTPGSVLDRVRSQTPHREAWALRAAGAGVVEGLRTSTLRVERA